jgi:hypothetical protein
MQSVQEFMGSMVQRLSITYISNRIDKNRRSARGWGACLVRMSKWRARPVRMRILINPERISSGLKGKRSPQIVFCSLSLNVISRVYVITYAQAIGIFVLKLIEPVITLKKERIRHMSWYSFCPHAGRADTFVIATKVSKRSRTKNASPRISTHPPLLVRAYAQGFKGSVVQMFSGSEVRRWWMGWFV